MSRFLNNLESIIATLFNWKSKIGMSMNVMNRYKNNSSHTVDSPDSFSLTENSWLSVTSDYCELCAIKFFFIYTVIAQFVSFHYLRDWFIESFNQGGLMFGVYVLIIPNIIPFLFSIWLNRKFTHAYSAALIQGYKRVNYSIIFAIWENFFANVIIAFTMFMNSYCIRTVSEIWGSSEYDELHEKAIIRFVVLIFAFLIVWLVCRWAVRSSKLLQKLEKRPKFKNLLEVPLNYGKEDNKGTLKTDGVQIIGKDDNVLCTPDLCKDYVFLYAGNVIIIKEDANLGFLANDIKEIAVNVCGAPKRFSYNAREEKWNKSIPERV